MAEVKKKGVPDGIFCFLCKFYTRPIDKTGSCVPMYCQQGWWCSNRKAVMRSKSGRVNDIYYNMKVGGSDTHKTCFVPRTESTVTRASRASSMG